MRAQTGANLSKWAGVALTVGAMVVSVTYAIAQRPTTEEVDRQIDVKQAPVANAVREQTTVLRELSANVQALREQAIREEVRRELERRQ